MNKLTIAFAISVLSISISADGIRIVNKSSGYKVPQSYEEGFSNCRSEISQQFQRSDRLRFAAKSSASRSFVNKQRTFHMPATVKGAQKGTRVAVNFTCATNYRGNRIVSIEQAGKERVASNTRSVVVSGR